MAVPPLCHAAADAATPANDLPDTSLPSGPCSPDVRDTAVAHQDIHGDVTVIGGDLVDDLGVEAQPHRRG